MRFFRKQGVIHVEVASWVLLLSHLPFNVSQHFGILMCIFEKCMSDQHIHFSFPP